MTLLSVAINETVSWTAVSLWLRERKIGTRCENSHNNYIIRVGTPIINELTGIQCYVDMDKEVLVFPPLKWLCLAGKGTGHLKRLMNINLAIQMKSKYSIA